MKKIFIILFTAIIFISCSNEDKIENIDEKIYNAFKALKSKDKEKFISYFDLQTINKLSISEFDIYYNQYLSAVENYELPEYNKWKKDRLFYQKDSINQIVRIGLPFIANATSSAPQYVVKIKYGDDNLLRGFFLNKAPTANDLSERNFPHMTDKFSLSTDNLISVRFYFLPGQNPSSENAKSVEFKGNSLTENILIDVKLILERINNSKIENAIKVSVSEEKNTNNLRAILFDFKDVNEIVSLNIINNADQDKFLKINHFYILNAANEYELAMPDKTDLNRLLKDYIEKYLK